MLYIDFDTYTYIDFDIEKNDNDPEFKVGDHVGYQNTKPFLQ